MNFDKTWNTRYDEMGITGHIRQYANNHHGVLDVIDVGCSTGISTKTTQECLSEHGINIKTTGIDSSLTVKSKAIKNLNHFEPENIFSSKLDVYAGKADVVICVNVVNWFYNMLNKFPFFNRDSIGIIKRCLTFLKNDGILITDSSNAKSINEIMRFDWQHINLCSKATFYKLHYLRRSSAYGFRLLEST